MYTCTPETDTHIYMFPFMHRSTVVYKYIRVIIHRGGSDTHYPLYAHTFYGSGRSTQDTRFMYLPTF